MVVYNDYSPDQRVRREAEALVKRGDEVDCICLHEGRDKTQTLKGVTLFYPRLRKYRGKRIILYLAQYLAFFVYTFIRLSTLHLRKRYDIVQVHTMPDFLVFVALIPKALGAKIILDVHDLMPELFIAKFGGPKERWLIRFITWVERRSIGFANRAICVHEPHLDILTGHGNPKEKFLVLLNLPDPDVFARVDRVGQESADKEFRLVYHGMIDKRVGLDVVLQAAQVARTEIPGLKFRIIGAGNDLARYAELSEELCRDSLVESVDVVPPEQLPRLLADADVGIVPYPKNEFTRCILPVKLLEYVALGIPVISSRLDVVEAYFNNDMVLYFEPGNADDLAQCVVDLYRNPAKRAQLAANAERFLQTYNWPKAKITYFALIDSLLLDKRRALPRLFRALYSKQPPRN